jgi:hypothetical protein
MTKDTAAKWQSGYDAGIEAAAKALEADAKRDREVMESNRDKPSI